MFSFQGASLSFFLKRLNEASTQVGTSVNLSILHFAFCILHFKKKWWAKMDSNHRPHDYQSCALASWAIGPYLVDASSISLASATRCPKLTHSAASPLQIKSLILRIWFGAFTLLWWRLAGSNRWPPACKAGALPAELNPQNLPDHIPLSGCAPSKLNNVKTYSPAADQDVIQSP